MPEYVLNTNGARDLWNSLDQFTRGFIEAAFWLGDEDAGIPGASLGELAPEAIERAKEECAEFLAEARPFLDQTDADDHQHGVDFFLTRNHHGAGFWDRGYGDVGESLTAIADAYGPTDLYYGDDGRLYFA